MTKKRVELIATLVVELIAIIIGWIYFISPTLDVQNRPTSVIPKVVSVLAVEVPDASAPTNVQITTSLQDPRSADEVTVDISVLIKQEVQPSKQPDIVLAGRMAQSLDTCTNPANALIERDVRWSDLNEQQRTEITARTADELSDPGDSFQDSQDKQPEVARKVQEDRYTRVLLSLNETQFTESSDDGSQTSQALRIETVCSFARDAFWTQNGGDSVLVNPTILVQYGGAQVGPGTFYYSTSFPKLQDYSIVSTNTPPSSNEESFKWFRNQDADCYKGDGQDKDARRNCVGVSAIVRSAATTQNDSRVVFLGGVALGVVATVSVDAVRISVILIAGLALWGRLWNRIRHNSSPPAVP